VCVLSVTSLCITCSVSLMLVCCVVDVVPATLNGDVINRAQFEALQHAMNQLEVCVSFIHSH